MVQLDLGRLVGSAHPPFLIAALDCRELATLDHALAALDAAADSRYDAIKPVRMPWAWSPRLFAHADRRALAVLATALDEAAVARLDWLGAPGFYLVYDWSDLELVACAARTGKPIVLQVGTASEGELAEVIETARANGDGGIALVHSALDAQLEGLDALHRHGAVVGISDRSPGTAIPLAAISRGACIVEKRFRLRADGDALCKREVASVVRDCEQAWARLGDGRRWAYN
ncbi:MAG TPA: N-acetylneuraminate synthase family protein [Kofleriaceae bacterium]|nr:N-acetylneuraminate synthase family protein [Kofleriaceae bacterium]